MTKQEFCDNLFGKVHSDAQRKVNETRALIDEMYEKLEEQKKALREETSEHCSLIVDATLREYFNLPQDQQESIRKSYVEPTILKIKQEEPVQKKKRGRPRKNDPDKIINEKPEAPLEVVDDDYISDRTQLLPEELAKLPQDIQEFYRDNEQNELIPDLSAEDLIRVNAPCVITEKEDVDETIFSAIKDNCEVQRPDDPELRRRLNGSLIIFGKVTTNLGFEDDVIRFFESLFAYGQFNLKDQGDLQAPNRRHDLWLIACEKARQALWKATNGALQIQYFVKGKDKYLSSVPYESVWVRIIKPGKLSKSQELAFNAYQKKSANRT